MNNTALRFGPDPTRSLLQRHNAMYPQHYGVLGQAPQVPASSAAGDGDGSDSLAIFGALFAIGAAGVCGALAVALLDALPVASHPFWLRAVCFCVAAIPAAVAAFALRRIAVWAATTAVIAYVAFLFFK